MLRYKTKTRPGLVALYDIRPGNGAGPFLQPRSPHGAEYVGNERVSDYCVLDDITLVLKTLKSLVFDDDGAQINLSVWDDDDGSGD